MLLTHIQYMLDPLPLYIRLCVASSVFKHRQSTGIGDGGGALSPLQALPTQLLGI